MDRRRDDLEPLSRAMCQFLRHRCKDLDPDGFVDLEVLMAAVQSSAPRGARGAKDLEAAIRRAVAENSKQRFEWDPANSRRIRATQGHSVEGLDDAAMFPKLDVAVVPVAWHGTYRRHLDAIRAQGLKRMGRRHVHCSAAIDAISGARRDAQVFLRIDTGAAVAAGVPFYMATNGVVLTPGEGATGVLPTRYILGVQHGRGEGAVWEPWGAPE
jgi:RNA:NAD 2'-phosphotransferase (TPT1/KptA family)